jgi:competence protein ComEA
MASAVIVVFGFLFYQLNQKNSQPSEIIKSENNTFEATSSREENGSLDIGKNNSGNVPKVIKVDVKGAVQSPGVYVAKTGERVIDLVRRAGNFEKNADSNKVNLAQEVQDQMVIYVPLIGEEDVQGIAATPAGATESGNISGTKEGVVNLNTAGESDFDELPGIGPSKAAMILEYREKNGPFKTVEDLKNISGIGDKTFEKLKDMITVQ